MLIGFFKSNQEFSQDKNFKNPEANQLSEYFDKQINGKKIG